MQAPLVTTYRPSDLQRRYRALLNEAKEAGEVRVQDSDGAVISVVPARRLAAFRLAAETVPNLLAIERILSRPETDEVAPHELGDWTWLRLLDRDDLTEFAHEIGEALVILGAEENDEPLRTALREWRITAQQLEDPVRRQILLGGSRPADYVDAAAPSETSPSNRGGA